MCLQDVPIWCAYMMNDSIRTQQLSLPQDYRGSLEFDPGDSALARLEIVLFRPTPDRRNSAQPLAREVLYSERARVDQLGPPDAEF